MYKYFLRFLSFFLIFIIIMFTKSSYSSNISTKDNKYIIPVKYIKITSPFGYRNLSGYKKHFHNGIDMANKEGTPVFATQEGNVVFAKFNGAYGYTILISHANNVKSMYCHLSPNFLVYPGKTVARGEQIGTIGPSILTNDKNYYWFMGAKRNGMTTGPHLHFSIIENGKYVDPNLYIKK